MKVTINKKQRVYVIPAGKGYSCYGFENCIEMRNKLAIEYNRPDLTTGKLGSLKAYKELKQLYDVAHAEYTATGKQSVSGLNKNLTGLEGKRVEVMYTWGEKERFYVGKSTGWIPCHLIIKRSNSIGGGSVTDDKNILFVKEVSK